MPITTYDASIGDLIAASYANSYSGKVIKQLRQNIWTKFFNDAKTEVGLFTPSATGIPVYSTSFQL